MKRRGADKQEKAHRKKGLDVRKMKTVVDVKVRQEETDNGAMGQELDKDRKDKKRRKLKLIFLQKDKEHP